MKFSREIFNTALICFLSYILFYVPFTEDVQADYSPKSPMPDKSILPVSEGSMPNGYVHFSEIECLAEAIYFEARSEPIKRHVVDVIFNRVRSKYFPNTVCDVVFQPYQFSFTLNLKRVINERLSYKDALKLASSMFGEVYSGRYVDDTGGALYYYNPDLVDKKPAWVSENFFLFRSGSHLFFSWHSNA